MNDTDLVTCRSCGSQVTSGSVARWFCHHCGAYSTQGDAPWEGPRRRDVPKTPVFVSRRPQDVPGREIPVQTPETDRAELADIMRRHTRRFVLYVSVIAEDPADDGRREHTLPFLNERISLESRAVAEALFEHLAGQVKLAGFFKPVLDKAP